MPLRIVDTVRLFWWLVPQGSRDRQPLHKSWNGLSTSVAELGTSLGAVSIIPLRHLTAASATGLDWLLYFTNFSKLPLMWRVQHRNHWSTVSDFSDNFNSICGIFRGFQLSLSPDLALSPLPSALWFEVTQLRRVQHFLLMLSEAVLGCRLLFSDGSLAGRFLTAGFRCAQNCSWAAFSDALISQLDLELAWNSSSILVHAGREHEEKFRESRQLPFGNWALWSPVCAVRCCLPWLRSFLQF